MEISQSAQEMSQAIVSYIAEEEARKLAEAEKGATKKGAHASDAVAIEIGKIRAEYLPKNWLDAMAEVATQIRYTTHGIKYSSPYAQGSSICLTSTQNIMDGVVGTASIQDITIDLVVKNAAILGKAKFFNLSTPNARFFDYIVAEDFSPLIPIAESVEQAKSWMKSFRVLLSDREPYAHSKPIDHQGPSSHKLAKQTYWPVGDGYHLLCPLFASSFTQAIYERVQHSRYSDEVKAARDARKKQQYHPQPIISFPELAVQSFGGSNQQNISQLNARRGGKAYLFSSAPPSWQSQVKAPLNITSVVDGPFVRQEYGRIKELREYLKRHLDSPSVKAIRAGRQRRIEAIVDQFIAFPARYMNVKPGWSQSPECKLPLHQQLWLDPGRCQLDEAFAFEYDKKNWQGQVADDFARMLNRLLKLGDQINVGQPEYAQWKVEVAQELRLAKQEVGGIL
ncbi:type I-F CRISPR-associated protein Csy1 [Bacterioplanes sanyensis]|uniref:type I-F CRISPR-associated protein Csy1 n=1 Tax=Bacterioplanes sanyensis TaxID=1249553 RepID=UPI0016754F77|nr:type I-F CRISPR-associated protein Csy1 [Bacterioplanes sanyensis]GGY57550.1 type I-F CRISPR-associated protein Csy1 [Bacterioplanes sanyensis]